MLKLETGRMHDGNHAEVGSRKNVHAGFTWLLIISSEILRIWKRRESKPTGC